LRAASVAGANVAFATVGLATVALATVGLATVGLATVGLATAGRRSFDTPMSAEIPAGVNDTPFRHERSEHWRLAVMTLARPPLPLRCPAVTGMGRGG
jgi:hypothetical protein